LSEVGMNKNRPFIYSTLRYMRTNWR